MDLRGSDLCAEREERLSPENMQDWFTWFTLGDEFAPPWAWLAARTAGSSILNLFRETRGRLAAV